jgi:hypothetical protein
VIGFGGEMEYAWPEHCPIAKGKFLEIGKYIDFSVKL